MLRFSLLAAWLLSFSACFDLFLEADEILTVPDSAEGFIPRYSTEPPSAASIVLRGLEPRDTVAILTTPRSLFRNERFYDFTFVWGDGVAIIERNDVGQVLAANFLELPGVIDVDLSPDTLHLYVQRHELNLTFTEQGIQYGTFEETDTPIDVHRPLRFRDMVDDSRDLIRVYFECVQEDLGDVVDWEPATLTSPNCILQ